MKKVLAAALLAASVGTPALAADMAVKARPVVASPAYDWSGFYVGAQVGGGWSKTDFARVGPTVGTVAYSVKEDSLAAGAFIGLQKQFGQFVLGIEGDYVTTFGTASVATPSLPFFFPGGTGLVSVKGARDIWTGGGRVGYAFNTWLPYVTGGYASALLGYDGVNVPSGTGQETANARIGGYYIGGGLDYAIAPQWVLGVEYRHYDFKHQVVNGILNAGFVESIDLGGKADTVMARLSFKFNPWSAGAVVAKY